MTLPNLVKAVSQEISVELLQGLIGKFVHATINEHNVPNNLDGTSGVQNAWFAGMVAGFEVATIGYDFKSGAFYAAEPVLFYNLLLTDGSGWALSKDRLELSVLTDSEFTELIAQEQAKQILEVGEPAPSLILPDNKGGKLVTMDELRQQKGK
jgi:hypothetical protein